MWVAARSSSVGGNSGCGKSVLFKHIVGLYTPRGGTIRVGGRDAVSHTPETRRRCCGA